MKGDRTGREGKANEIFSATLAAVYLNNGENLKEAARYATAASAYSEPDEDGNCIIPTREDILHLV
jgi:sugar/nucleoside kinase (ribokinase family)